MKRQLLQGDSHPVVDLNVKRLGKCEICNYEDAKYTCPKCEIKSCCIKCLNIHKKELNCDGVRDRTKFIPLKKMTKLDFINDYYFLEECTRYVQDRKTDKMKRYTRYNKTLPTHLFKLRNAALERKTTLRFLLPNFSRHISNTTFYDYSTKIIQWRIEWIFVNAKNLKCIDKRCDENLKLYKLLDKYMSPDSSEELPMKKYLEVYRNRGIKNVKILLKAEGIKRASERFFELNYKKTLRENLANKTIIEHPIIHICYDIAKEAYDIIDSDEDLVAETKSYYQMIDEKFKPDYKPKPKTEEAIKKEAEESKRKRRLERKKARAENKNQPKNYLFPSESQADGSNPMGSSSSSDETEEEP